MAAPWPSARMSNGQEQRTHVIEPLTMSQAKHPQISRSAEGQHAVHN